MGPVKVTHLGQNNNDCSCLLDLNNELCVGEPSDPTNVDAIPLLHDSPLLVKESGSVDVSNVIHHVLKRHPKDAIIPKRVTKLLEPTCNVSTCNRILSRDGCILRTSKVSTPLSHLTTVHSTPPNRHRHAVPKGSCSSCQEMIE